MIRYLRPAIVLALLSLSLPHGFTEQPPSAVWTWRFITGGATVGAPAFSNDGLALFTTEDRYLYALDRGGTMIWRTDLGRRPAGGIIVGTDGTILVTLENGDLIALNRDGRLIWQHGIDRLAPYAPVVAANGLVFTAGRTGTLEARTHTGRQLWSVDLGVPVSAAPVLGSDGRIAVGGANGEVFLVSVDGRVLHRRYLGEIASALAPRAGGLLVGSTSGRIVAVDRELEPLWRADVGSAVRTIAVGTDGEAYAVTDDAALSRVTTDGVLAWKTPQAVGRVVAIAASEYVLAVTREAYLLRIDRGGDVTARYRLADRPLSLAVDASGTALVATAGWVTYAIPDGIVPGGPWPQDRGGSDRRGVVPGADRGRVEMGEYQRYADYLVMRSRLLTGSESEQVVAMADIADRVARGELVGRHQYFLQLSELIAGSPYFGQLTQFGAKAAPRRAREEAVVVLGQIGDLATARFLARLLTEEVDPSLQSVILQSMANLGTPIDREMAAVLARIVRRDTVRGPNDTLGRSIVAFVDAVRVYRGGYLHPDAVASLVAVSTGGYSRSVREYALEVMSRLTAADGH